MPGADILLLSLGLVIAIVTGGGKQILSVCIDTVPIPLEGDTVDDLDVGKVVRVNDRYL